MMVGRPHISRIEPGPADTPSRQSVHTRAACEFGLDPIAAAASVVATPAGEARSDPACCNPISRTGGEMADLRERMIALVMAARGCSEPEACKHLADYFALLASRPN